MSQVIGGRYTTQGTFRSSRVGSWFVLSTQDGQLRGGLRLNVLDPDETQRLQAILSPAPGLLNVVDQVRHEDGHWLITAAPATPTVAEALQARVEVPPTVALLIAIDTAQTLAALHDAGIAHGGLSADAVILGEGGRLLLAECGYAHALAGTKAGPGHDTSGWIKFVRGLATPRQADDDAKRLLNAAADEAEALGGTAGLTTALTNLSNQAIRLPGYGDRSALQALAAMVPNAASVAPPPKPVRPEEGETVALNADAVNATVLLAPQAAGETVPLAQSALKAAASVPVPRPPSIPQPPSVPQSPVGRVAQPPTVPQPPSVPQPAVGRAAQPPSVPQPPSAPAGVAPTAVLRDPMPVQETMKPAQLAAQMDQRKDEVLRFGRGVAPLPPPQKRPPLADTGWAGDLPQQRPMKPRKPWRTRVIGIMSAIVTLVLVAWVGYQIIQRLIPLRIAGVVVNLAEPLGDKCDVQARVVGTIRTNGAAGTLTYRWLTSDGKTTAILAEQVNLGTDRVQVPLLWTFSGKSAIRAKATLQILTPSELEASTQFTYSCR